MQKQKQKNILKDSAWLIAALLIVSVSSLTLSKIYDYSQSKYTFNSVYAATAGSKNNIPQPRQTVTSVSGFIKQGCVGGKFAFQPFPNNTSENEDGLPLTPTVLGYQFVQKSYQAELIKKSYSVVNIEPGKRITYEIEFKNTGTETWRNYGDHFIALNVTDPAGRESLYRDPFWPKSYRPAVMNTVTVKPGEIGVFRFALTAPLKKDEYVEKFNLVAENLTWIDGGYIDIAMRVGNPKPHFQAQLVDQSAEAITLNAGETATVWADFKNTGSRAWSNNGGHFIALNASDPSGRNSVFQDSSWPEYYRPAKLKNNSVAPNAAGRVEFKLKAPITPGIYLENFSLVAENLTWINGGGLAVTITVQPNNQSAISAQGPNIRVGLYNTVSEIKITGSGNYEIRNSQNELIGIYEQNEIAAINYVSGKYELAVKNDYFSSILPLRFIPQGQTVLEITNFENRPAWNANLNDNKYRGVLEINYSDTTQKLWVINELPLEYYLRGIAEASNDNSPEYLKALMTAARTYARYHLEYPVKHNSEKYTVDAIYDQVYKGYGFELRSPNITKAVTDTTGTMVLYNNEVVVTPYFSQSDGRTRSWAEVWSGGPYPWLVSVTDPACTGKVLLGHGIGMSAYGARDMAETGNNYEEILKHYYTGIDLEKFY